MRRVAIYLTLVAVAFLSGVIISEAISATQSSSSISSVGTVKAVGVGVYWDSGFTNRTAAINWGVLDPGTQKSFILYIRNEGNSAIILSQSASNWTPSTAANYLTVSWNYNNQALNPGSSVQVTLTLAVNGGITGISNFGFDITIMGSG